MRRAEQMYCKLPISYLENWHKKCHEIIWKFRLSFEGDHQVLCPEAVEKFPPGEKRARRTALVNATFHRKDGSLVTCDGTAPIFTKTVSLAKTRYVDKKLVGHIKQVAMTMCGGKSGGNLCQRSEDTHKSKLQPQLSWCLSSSKFAVGENIDCNWTLDIAFLLEKVVLSPVS